jgi:hypothetical protein
MTALSRVFIILTTTWRYVDDAHRAGSTAPEAWLAEDLYNQCGEARKDAQDCGMIPNDA